MCSLQCTCNQNFSIKQLNLQMYMIKTYVYQLYFLKILMHCLCVESFLLREVISNILSDQQNVTIEHCSTEVTEGDNATLSCNATGSPSPETAWIREKTGEVLSYSKIHQITSINRNETGAYVCLAWNGIGKNSSKSCLVVVQCKCTILFPLYHLGMLGETSKFFCSHSG